jgi:hypothetical protein
MTLVPLCMEMLGVAHPILWPQLSVDMIVRWPDYTCTNTFAGRRTLEGNEGARGSVPSTPGTA